MAQRSLIRLRDLFPDGAYAECACDDGVPCLAHYGLLEPDAQIAARARVGILSPERGGHAIPQGRPTGTLPAGGRF